MSGPLDRSWSRCSARSTTWSWLARRHRATEAVALIERERPDLALLDWQMPELDGIGVVGCSAPDAMPLVAFVTAFDEYAVRAFELNAVDYLLKPVDGAAARTLNRVQERLEQAEIVAEQDGAGGAASHEPAGTAAVSGAAAGAPTRAGRARPRGSHRLESRTER